MQTGGHNNESGDLVDLNIPAPRVEMTAEEVRERIIALAPSTLELRKRLSDKSD
jgi:hypothetical protein